MKRIRYEYFTRPELEHGFLAIKDNVLNIFIRHAPLLNAQYYMHL
jgi:hypothetical protein